jgi:hypothetical protein
MFSIPAPHNNARLQGTANFADTGVQNSRIRLYATAQPAMGADPGAAPLVEILLTKPCGTVVDNALLLTQAAPGGDLIATTGAALWGRWINGNGDLVADGVVTDSAGNGDIKLSGTLGTMIYSGGHAILVATALV